LVIVKGKNMIDLTILAIGPLKDKNLRTVANNYIKRVKPYVRLRVQELTAASFSVGSQAKAKEQEGKTILNYLDKRASSLKPASVYLLAERGKCYDSPQLARWLEQEQPLILVIGGALGFSPDLYARYSQISLSPLTFPHELARVILLEQIYRAAAIINQKDYHY